MKQRRPNHNSPLKARGPEGKGKGKAEEAEKDVNVEDLSENAMMIKQLVTRLEEPQHGISPIEDPYSPRSASKYYVAEVLKQYLNPDSLVREHLFSSLYFLQMLSVYALPDNQPPSHALPLPQRDKYRSNPLPTQAR
jgi:hypothetical protein